MGWRDQKAKVRRAVHECMKQPASFYLTPASDPVLVYARPHNKPGLTGDLAGTNLNYAETRDREETVVFWRDEIIEKFSIASGIPPRGARIVFAADEGYEIDHVRPPDGDTVTAEVFGLDAGDLALLTPPEDL